MKTSGLQRAAMALVMALSLSSKGHAATFLYAPSPQLAFSGSADMLPARLNDITGALLAPLSAIPKDGWSATVRPYFQSRFYGTLADLTQINPVPYGLRYTGWGPVMGSRGIPEGVVPELMVWTLLIGGLGMLGFTFRLRRLANRVLEIIED